MTHAVTNLHQINFFSFPRMPCRQTCIWSEFALEQRLDRQAEHQTSEWAREDKSGGNQVFSCCCRDNRGRRLASGPLRAVFTSIRAQEKQIPKEKEEGLKKKGEVECT